MITSEAICDDLKQRFGESRSAVIRRALESYYQDINNRDKDSAI